MAFSELELKYVQSVIGRLCKRRFLSHLRDKIRTIYEIQNNDIIIFEERPKFKEPHEWSKTPCAKFKYDRTNKEWRLYWMRKDLKWHRYQTETKSGELEELVAEVDIDRYGAFFG